MRQKSWRKILIILSLNYLLVIVLFLWLLLPKVDNTSYKLTNNLQLPVYSKVKVKDLITSMKGKVITNKTINTDKLGEQEVTFIYKSDKGQKKLGKFKIEIVDNEEPLIWLSDSYSVKVGSKIDLEKEILCADNYDEKPTCKIKGKYDINTPGKYNLTYIATDSSHNEEKINFTLNVYQPVSTVPTTKEEQLPPLVTTFQEVVENHKTKNTEIGIDVSKWQKEIDFKKVKEEGASFVMIRVGSQQGVNGKYILDPYFKKNIENAIKNNLKVGGYFYSYASSNKEAKKQANWVLKQIKNYDISLPIAFDWECYNDFNAMELSLFGLNEIAETFLERIEQEGYKGMLYGSKNYLNAIWKYHNHDVWLAHYTKQTDYTSDYIMWQLCQNGQIDGINGLVDIDILYQNNK